jgi:hypothetical protein
MWDERYGEPGLAYGSSPNEFLVSMAGKVPRGRVLSLAEGDWGRSCRLSPSNLDAAEARPPPQVVGSSPTPAIFLARFFISS